jgi:hypothetical protein
MLPGTWDLTLLEQQPRMTMAKFALSLLVAATHAVVLVVPLLGTCPIPCDGLLDCLAAVIGIGCRDGPSFRLDLSNVAHGALSVL